MGNIILDEVKNGGKEARQVVQQDTGELRDFFKRKVRACARAFRVAFGCRPNRSRVAFVASAPATDFQRAMCHLLQVGAAPEEHVVHPIFGELVKDLVYKKSGWVDLC